MGTPETESTIDGTASRPQKRLSLWPLVAICVGYFMVILDTMVVNVALPVLSKSLHTSTSGLQAITNGLDWFTAASILISYMRAIAWVAASVGLLARSLEAAGNATFVMMFLPHLSRAFVSVSTMPTWIRGFATHEPLSPIIDSFRGLHLHTPTGQNPPIAIAWCAGILLAATIAASFLFRRQSG